MKILLVEDDETITSALLEGLGSHRYLVHTTQNGQTGLELAKTFSYDVILLDVVLPGLDGLSVCRKLRQQGCQTPVLVLSAKDQSCDRIVGLEAGADDYLVKPFELSEVVARIQALLRRSRETACTTLNWEHLCVNPQSQEVFYQGQLIHLTPKEYGLLELFLRNPHQLFTRSSILDHLWLYDKCPAEEAVNTHVKVLRHKLKASGLKSPIIETVYGLGYRLMNAPVLPVTEEPVNSPSSANSNFAEQQQAEAKVAASIAKIWDVFKTHWQDQLDLLRQVSEQLKTSAADENLLKDATAAAHRLVGALGTFGRPAGTEVARCLETLLQSPIEPSSATAEQVATLVERLQQIIDSPCPEPNLTDTSPCVLAEAQTVIVVDDDPQILAAVPKILESIGFQVIALGNPQRLYKTLEVTRPALLILDIEMPNLNGIDLCKAIRSDQRWQSIPILFLTAHVDAHIQNRAFSAGADDYVTKPVVPSELKTRVMNRLERVHSLLSAEPWSPAQA